MLVTNTLDELPVQLEGSCSCDPIVLSDLPKGVPHVYAICNVLPSEEVVRFVRVLNMELPDRFVDVVLGHLRVEAVSYVLDKLSSVQSPSPT